MAVAIAVASCGRSGGGGGRIRPGTLSAVGAESQYANVISQIGGRYVSVAAIMDNPNIDPHSFEASPSIAQTVTAAKLIVQNGLGYDAFMNRIESASPNARRRIIDVQKLMGLADSTRNPHLWYDPAVMARVASQVATDLSALKPAHAAYFRTNARRFAASLRPLLDAVARFRRQHPGTRVATTEPVGNYLLNAIGAHNISPWNLQADLMNGVDPAPQDISRENGLLREHRVKVLLYNQQVTDTLTQSFLQQAAAVHVPVVGLYETLPTGFDYQSWMLAEVEAMQRAVTTGKSTTRLQRR